MIRQSQVVWLLLLHFAMPTANYSRHAPAHRVKPRVYASGGLSSYQSNYTDLEHNLRTPSMGKLVVFSSHHCGDCRRFGSSFRQLEHWMLRWRRILAIYVVDCEEKVNICQDFDIQHMPALRFFPSKFVRGRDGTGTEIRSRVPEDIAREVATRLAHNQYTGATMPNFKPIQAWETPKSLMHINHRIKYVVLVFQPRHSQIGVFTLLDLLPYPEVSVRIVEDRELFGNFDLKPFGQTLAVLEGGVVAHQWTSVPNTSKEYVTRLRRQLGLIEHKETLKSRSPRSSGINLEADNKNILGYVQKQPTTIFRDDIEMAIGYMLHSEIPRLWTIPDSARRALLTFLDVLIRSRPMESNDMETLVKFHTYLKSTPKLTGEKFRELLYCHELTYGRVVRSRDYVACRGSGASMRGYTCALWQLFHFMSVQKEVSAQVSSAIDDFIRYIFPSCPFCGRRFRLLNDRPPVSKHLDDSILWLWKAHNMVNNRLQGGRLQDPWYPKVPYPTSRQCPGCLSTGNIYNRAAVTSFLKNTYSRKALASYRINLNASKLVHCTPGRGRMECRHCRQIYRIGK